MPELSVVVIAQDSEQRAVLQVLVDGTSVARVVHTCTSYPVVVTDPVLRRVQSANPQVVLVDVPADNHTLALRAIELIHQEVRDAVIFAVGSMAQPQVIVSAMRSGAREFIERPTTTTDLLEAFVRLTAAQRKVDREGPRGKVFTVVNAKGGSGATTTAVNLALALHSAHGNVALVDIAPLGHAALHMNLKPQFTVADAIRNLHRLDSSLLESFMTRHSGGLQLLAGANTPVVGGAGDGRVRAFVRFAGGPLPLRRGRCVFASGRDYAPGVQPFRNRAAGGPCRCRVAVERDPDPAISGRDRRAGASTPGAEPLPQDRRFQRSRCRGRRREPSCCGRFPINISRCPPPSIAEFRSCNRPTARWPRISPGWRPP